MESLHYVVESVQDDAKEGVEHGEQHPDINQLHVCSLGQRLVNPSKTRAVLIITMGTWCHGNREPG